MVIVDCQQGTPEWWQARLGLPTASEFDKILTPAKLEPSTQAEGYMNKLIGEALRGKPDETFQSDWMKRGKENEAEARDYYAFTFKCEPRQVGFCLHDSKRYGCSPDFLLEGGGGELKVVSPGVLISYHRKGVLPLDYRLQVIGSIVVSGLDFWDFMAYHEDLKPFYIRTERQEVLKDITAIMGAVNKFCDKLETERELLRSRFQ